MKHLRSVFFGLAAVFCTSLTISSEAGAAPYNPATDGLTGWTATAGFTESWYFIDEFPNFGVTFETALETKTGLTLTAVGGADCGGTGVACDTVAKSGTYTGLGANFFAIHFGGNGHRVIAFLYPSLISLFTISGLPNAVSFIRAFDTPVAAVTSTPLPGALLLMGTVLVGSYGVGAWRKRRTRGSVVAVPS